MMKNSKLAILTLICIALLFPLSNAVFVYYIDPFMHYHAPLADYYYSRPNTMERYINDGVLRHFEYNALITGVSVSNDFSISEFNDVFDVDAVKVIYLGGTYKEVAEGIDRALKTNPETRIVFNNLFLNKLLQDKDHRRSDIRNHPTYLYNDNLIDDAEYLFNKEVLFNYCIPMISARLNGAAGGVESLDRLGYIGVSWNNIERYAPYNAAPDSMNDNDVIQPSLSETERLTVTENVQQNIVAAAIAHPETRFIYYVPPCSILNYKVLYDQGDLLKTLEAEKVALNLMLTVPNIEVYSFNDRPEIITDMRNYFDEIHYGPWIASYILDSISKGDGRITAENVEGYCSYENDFFLNYDYCDNP